MGILCQGFGNTLVLLFCSSERVQLCLFLFVTLIFMIKCLKSGSVHKIERKSTSWCVENLVLKKTLQSPFMEIGYCEKNSRDNPLTIQTDVNLL